MTASGQPLRDPGQIVPQKSGARVTVLCGAGSFLAAGGRRVVM
jgi:hypothetical protein